MAYIIAFDGGGSKTRCILADLKGHVLFDETGAASNHQTVGKAVTKQVFKSLLDTILMKAAITKSQLLFTYLGLSGADLEEDFNVLNDICMDVFSPIPYKIVNDAWICMRSGLTSNWGAVSICGTGANYAAIHPNGNKHILRSLSYELGNYGGGEQISRMALHHAFRSNEESGSFTLLESEIPKVLGFDHIENLFKAILENHLDMSLCIRNLPPLVFELASNRDEVCQNILMDVGSEMGTMMNGVIKTLHMEDMPVPIVLGGSVFASKYPLLRDAFTTVIHQLTPNAHIILPTLPPVAGAYLSTLDELNVDTNDNIYHALEQFF